MSFDLVELFKAISINVNVNVRQGSVPPRPDRPSLGRKRELASLGATGMSQFGIVFNLPAPKASDVASRELIVTVQGQADPIVQTKPGDARESDELIFDADAIVRVTLSDTDAHGNHGAPSAAFVFTVVDDVAPGAPDAVGVLRKRQID